MENNLEYSTDALGVKAFFYNKKISVYVEGPEDVLFWNYLFDYCNINAHFEDVGGDKEIEKYISRIMSNNGDFYVACDRDHKDFTKKEIINHERIITTYGYSIENSLYNARVINDFSSNLAKQKVDEIQLIDSWIYNFTEQSYKLIIYDVANHLYEKGISIFSDNCTRFLKSDRSYELSIEKIENFIESKRNQFSDTEIAEVKLLLESINKEKWYHIKGHFITHAVINLLKHIIEKHSNKVVSISLDNLYAYFIDCCKRPLNTKDFDYMLDRIRKINVA